MTDFTDKTISEIVRDDYRTADVFKNYGINFCCSGGVALREACDARQLDLKNIIVELETATRELRLIPNLQFNAWKIDFLVDYIINVHHAYLAKALPELDSLFLSFMSNHLKKYPELEDIYKVFSQLSALVLKHNKHEEEVVFPYIKHLEMAHRRKETYGSLFVKTLRKPMTLVGKDAEPIDELLMKLQSLTSNYSFPEKACTNHQVLYNKLRELHYDMIQHKHLENNILFVKATEIESQLLQGLNNEV